MNKGDNQYKIGIYSFMTVKRGGCVTLPRRNSIACAERRLYIFMMIKNNMSPIGEKYVTNGSTSNGTRKNTGLH